MLRLYVGITDLDWFRFLRDRPHLAEVNFWQPGGDRNFRALRPGELFLFKLHSPLDYIVGGGVFAGATILPVSLAWDTFGEANGAVSVAEMRARLARYRRTADDRRQDYRVGCIVLELLLLRRDLHSLFDAGYVTVALDYRLEVSRRIREEFENGRAYYAYHGAPVKVPNRRDRHPARDALAWHNQNVFLG